MLAAAGGGAYALTSGLQQQSSCSRDFSAGEAGAKAYANCRRDALPAIIAAAVCAGIFLVLLFISCCAFSDACCFAACRRKTKAEIALERMEEEEESRRRGMYDARMAAVRSGRPVPGPSVILAPTNTVPHGTANGVQMGSATNKRVNGAATNGYNMNGYGNRHDAVAVMPHYPAAGSNTASYARQHDYESYDHGLEMAPLPPPALSNEAYSAAAMHTPVTSTPPTTVMRTSPVTAANMQPNRTYEPHVNSNHVFNDAEYRPPATAPTMGASTSMAAAVASARERSTPPIPPRPRLPSLPRAPPSRPPMENDSTSMLSSYTASDEHGQMHGREERNDAHTSDATHPHPLPPQSFHQPHYSTTYSYYAPDDLHLDECNRQPRYEIVGDDESDPPPPPHAPAQPLALAAAPTPRNSGQPLSLGQLLARDEASPAPSAPSAPTHPSTSAARRSPPR